MVAESVAATSTENVREMAAVAVANPQPLNIILIPISQTILTRTPWQAVLRIELHRAPEVEALTRIAIGYESIH